MKQFLLESESQTQRLLAALPKRMRAWSLKQSLIQDRAVMVSGPRGVGKSTFLLSQAKQMPEAAAIYVAGDNPRLSNGSIYEFGEVAFEAGYQLLIVDEVHFAKNWSQDLKALYDAYPQKKIWISDSSSLILRKGSYDLSRRFPRLNMPLLSFREYLYLATGKLIEPTNIFTDGVSPDLGDLSSNILDLFRNYMNEGARPIFQEGRYKERTIAIIEKMIFSDVPYFVDQIQGSHLSLMNGVISHLALSPIPTINIESLTKKWSIGKPKVYELLTVMQDLEMINIVRHKSDHTSGKGAKILLADPTWYHVLNGDIGSQREAFVASMLRGSGQKFFASHNEQLGDFETPWGLWEIGGKNKTKKQADYVIRDDLIDVTPSKTSIPMWMLGFLY